MLTEEQKRKYKIHIIIGFGIIIISLFTLLFGLVLNFYPKQTNDNNPLINYTILDTMYIQKDMFN